MSIIVKAGAKDTTDSIIRKFQKRVIMEGVLQEDRDLTFHKKDSEKRQERMKEKRRKIMRARRFASE